MMIETYYKLATTHGEAWVKRFLPRCYADVERAFKRRKEGGAWQ